MRGVKNPLIMFIAFEGLDGSGSSTQAKLLAEKLQSQGKEVLLTKEPTEDTPLGKKLREALQHKWEATPEELQILFSADRAEHLKDVIQPALDAGKVVITDRYVLSTYAYGMLNVPLHTLKDLNQKFPAPDVTFLLKLSPEECLGRIMSRGNDVELFEKVPTLKKVWKNYEAVRGEHPNVHIIDASGSIEEVSAEIGLTFGL